MPFPHRSMLVAPSDVHRRNFVKGVTRVHENDRPFFALIAGGIVSLLALVGLLTVLHQFIPA
jgi:hypothetical protein